MSWDSEGDYDDYSDDYEDWQPIPAVKKPVQPAKKNAPPKPQIKKTKDKSKTTAPFNPPTNHNVDGCESEDVSTSEASKPQSLNVPKRRDLAEYQKEPELERLCKAMQTTQLNERTTLHLIILGHVDAGKSTLMGRLLHDMGYVDQKTAHKNRKQATEAGKPSFAWAWVLDERPEERERGVTIDVATGRFQTENFNVVLLDAPGHRDFVPNMISGATRADAAILAVDGSINGFEAGFQQSSSNQRSTGGGQTREHAQLARSFGIEQLAVVVTKLDTCEYSQDRFLEIQRHMLPFLQQCGFKRGSIQWLLSSAPTGLNIAQRITEQPLLSWFDGPTVLQAIDNFTPVTQNIDFPLRFPVTDIVQSRTLGSVAVNGKIEAGCVRVGSRLSVLPAGNVAVVKAIEVDGQRREFAGAGDSCEMGLNEIDAAYINVGSVLCSEGWPCAVATRFESRVVILDAPTPIIPGIQISLQTHAVRESANISRLISLIDSKTSATIKAKPRCLISGQTAEIELITSRPICIEEYATLRPMGRISLRESGRTIAVGVITSILDGNIL